MASSLSAQTYNNGLVDKSIATVGNEVIMLSQVESEVQMMMAQGITSDNNLRCRILENLMTQKLFLNQAKLDSLNVREDAVESELQKRIDNALTQLGGEKEAEAYFKKPLYRLKEQWRKVLREQNLTQQMQQNISSKAGTPTPKDVENFYKKTDKDSLPIMSTQYMLSEIVLFPNREKAGLEVKGRLLDLRKRIINGEKFSVLAAMYSQDASAVRGGDLGMAAKSLYWPSFSDAAVALKPGQVSQIVETPDGYHLIQMVKREGDMIDVRHILLKPEYTQEDKEHAFAKLDSIRNEINKDSISFEMAARKYSNDLKTAVNGGKMFDENTGSIYFEKDQLKPSDYQMLKNMKPGEISRPFQSLDNEGRGHIIYKIIKLNKIIPSHPANIKQDFMIIQNIAANRKKTEAIDKFIKDKQETTLIIIDDLFKKCKFEREGWFK
jgi:peptidyl-prolyl cis-trans isomerase SurA